jgi:hypothetical protein
MLKYLGGAGTRLRLQSDCKKVKLGSKSWIAQQPMKLAYFFPVSGQLLEKTDTESSTYGFTYELLKLSKRVVICVNLLSISLLIYSFMHLISISILFLQLQYTLILHNYKHQKAQNL